MYGFREPSTPWWTLMIVAPDCEICSGELDAKRTRRPVKTRMVPSASMLAPPRPWLCHEIGSSAEVSRCCAESKAAASPLSLSLKPARTSPTHTI
eukprot:6210404-Pleurochrysis_carterae.AAC.2